MKNVITTSLATAALLLATCGLAVADTIILKTGDRIEGDISLETDEFVRIIVQVTPSIRDEKTVQRVQIDKIERLSEEDIAFAEIEKLVPAPPMLSVTAYADRIKTAENFLSTFPNTTRKKDIEKILQELNDESEKAAKGFIKVENTWISPEERRQDPLNADARILAFQMRNKVAAGNYIGTLRDFDKMELQFKGTEAYVSSIDTALKALQSYATQTDGLLRDFDYKQKQREEGLQRLQPHERIENEALYQKQLADFEALLAKEKTARVKWITANPNHKDSLDDSAQLILKEITRIRAIDRDAMSRGAAQIAQIKETLAAGDVRTAQTQLREAYTTLGRGVPYLAQLEQDIKDTAAELAAAAKAAKENALSKEAVEAMKKFNDAKGDAGEDAAEDPLAAMREAAQEKNKDATPAKDPASAEKAAPTPEPKSTASPRPADPASSGGGGGGGISFQTIMMILAGIMVVVTVGALVLKKKQEG